MCTGVHIRIADRSTRVVADKPYVPRRLLWNLKSLYDDVAGSTASFCALACSLLAMLAEFAVTQPQSPTPAYWPNGHLTTMRVLVEPMRLWLTSVWLVEQALSLRPSRVERASVSHDYYLLAGPNPCSSRCSRQVTHGQEGVSSTAGEVTYGGNVSLSNVRRGSIKATKHMC